ncbi:unnamed protein product, partial [Nesidiocoris tenuis]
MEEINRQARYKTALDKLKHPWISTPSVSEFLASCSHLKDRMPLSVSGWIPTTVECNSTELNVTLIRPENSATTTKDVVKRIRDIFGVEAKFFFNQTSLITFSIKNSVKPNGDDPVADSGEQLLKIISLFQRVNINAALNAVEIKDVDKNEFGEKMPLQDWQEYTFDVETAIPPQLIFVRDEFSGIRLNKIIYTVDTERSASTFSYSEPCDAKIREEYVQAYGLSTGRFASRPGSSGKVIVVIRLISRRKQSLTLGELGLSEAQQNAIKSALAKPAGVIFSSGPTGHGKSTLSQCMAEIYTSENPGMNMLSVEDPIESPIEGTFQTPLISTDRSDGAKMGRAW